MEFSRLVRFNQTVAILFCNGEHNLGRASKPPKGASSQGKLFPSPPPGSLDTLPRLCLSLLTKMAAVVSKRTNLQNPTEK